MKALALGILLFFSSTCARAGDEPAPAAILEFGGAAQWGIGGGPSHGPNFGIETTPIPEVLEIEADVMPLFSRGESDWSSDFLLKKPFDISDRLEFMAGAGPEWDRMLAHGAVTDTIGAEVAGDFMYWPMPDRRFGWYAEPAYSYGFGPGHSQSMSLSIGLLIPIP